MATTQPVTLQELSEWMTEKARRTSSSKEMSVIVQYKLAKPDHDGKNWSDSLLIQTGDCGLDDALRAIGNAQREAMSRFHIG